MAEPGPPLQDLAVCRGAILENANELSLPNHPWFLPVLWGPNPAVPYEPVTRGRNTQFMNT